MKHHMGHLALGMHAAVSSARSDNVDPFRHNLLKGLLKGCLDRPFSFLALPSSKMGTLVSQGEL